MRECLRLAELGKGSVSPNPMVGAVLVRRGKVIGRGYHKRFGGAHAEVRCFQSVQGSCKGATLYVNLEPCSYYGKTPPCADLVIASGVCEVFIAMKDPNPLVAGRGIRKLRSAGIKVHVGLLQPEAERLNRFFIRYITSRRPYVHVKIAQTLDGMIAGPRGVSSWFTSPASRRLVHRMRADHDAILVGAGTIRSDNPRLTVRAVRGKDPHVVILDGRLRLPPKARVFESARKRLVCVCTTRKAAARRAGIVTTLRRAGVQVLEFENPSSTLRLRSVLGRLHELHIGSVLVEGGRQVFSQFIREDLIDELSIFIAPKLMGKGIPAFDERSRAAFSKLMAASSVSVDKTDGDVLIKSVVREE